MSKSKLWNVDFLDRVKNLFSNWGVFLLVIIQPIPLLSILAGLFAISNKTFFGESFEYIYAIICGIGGGAITSNWFKSKDKAVLETKGESALRNLNEIVKFTESLSRRIDEESRYLDTPSHDKSKQLIREIKGSLGGIKNITVNAIDDWKDILPNAKLLDQLAELSSIKKKWENTQKSISLLVSEISKSNNDKNKLQKQLKSTEDERDKLKETYNELETKFMKTTGYSPAFYASGSNANVPNFECQGCHCHYSLLEGDIDERGWLIFDCPSCNHHNETPPEIFKG